MKSKDREQLLKELGVSPESVMDPDSAEEPPMGPATAEQIREARVVTRTDKKPDEEDGMAAMTARVEELEDLLAATRIDFNEAFETLAARLDLLCLKQEEIDDRLVEVELCLGEEEGSAQEAAAEQEEHEIEKEDKTEVEVDELSLCPSCGADVGWDRLPFDAKDRSWPVPILYSEGKLCPACGYFEKKEGE